MYITTVRTSIIAATILALLSLGGVAYAQTAEGLNVRASGMDVTAVFNRSTPCTQYVLEWGDGEEEVFDEESEMCVQVIDRVSLGHEYEEAGEYTITLSLQGNEYEEEVSLPAPVISFELEDVKSITAKWVDPSPMMADEEYYIYTITLNSNEVIEVQAGGFTTQEYRNEQFEKAGYEGNVDELLEMVVQEDSDQATTTPPTDAPNLTVYQQLIKALQSLIERMQMLLELR